jgi:hypothetical protein
MEPITQESTLPPPPKKSLMPVVSTAVIVVVLGVGGLFWKALAAKSSGSAGAGVSPPAQAFDVNAGANDATVEQSQAATAKLPQLRVAAPPPPDESELEEAEAEAEAEAAQQQLPAKVPTGKQAAGKNVCAGPCGAPNRALTESLRQRAGAARGCYQSGLRQNSMLSGKMTVGVRISPDGNACYARPVANTLGDPSVTSCILQKFRAGGYPKPKGKCAEANVPLNFVSH